MDCARINFTLRCCLQFIRFPQARNKLFRNNALHFFLLSNRLLTKQKTNDYNCLNFTALTGNVLCFTSFVVDETFNPYQQFSLFVLIFIGKFKGLFGNNDGLKENDLVSRTGILIPANSSMSDIHQFGLTCKFYIIKNLFGLNSLNCLVGTLLFFLRFYTSHIYEQFGYHVRCNFVHKQSDIQSLLSL